MHILGDLHAVALRDLQNGADSINNVQSQHSEGHLVTLLEMAGESAAAEILIVGAAPIGAVQAGLDVGLTHLPIGLHTMLALFVDGGTAAVQCGGTAVDQMDDAVGRLTGQLLAADALAGLGAPIGTHVVEAGCGIGDQRAHQHRQTVKGIVFGGKGGGRLGAVPVKGGSKQALGKVAVGKPVGPVALTLEACDNGVFAQCLLVPAHLVQHLVAVHNITHDHGHTHHKAPIIVGSDHLGALDDVGQILARVDVNALGAVVLDPCHGALVFLVIVDLQLDAAQHLAQIHPLGTQAKVFLHHIGIAIAAHNAHGNAADIDIGLVLHPADSHSAASEAQDLFLHIGGDARVAHILYVTAVNGKGRQAALSVCGKHGGKVNRTGLFGAVEAPDRLDGVRVHIKGFGSVAPAGGHAEGGHHVLGGELPLDRSRLGTATDGGTADDALHGGTVGITQMLGDQRRRVFGHIHGLLLQALAHAAPAAVDNGSDADFRIIHITHSFLRLGLCFYFTIDSIGFLML